MALNKPLKIGLFGGSFNPPTTAHEALTVYAHRALGLDAFWWLVAPQNPFKPKAGMAPFEHRLAMAQIIADKHQPWLKASDLENQFDTRQTADTLRLILEHFPEHAFVWLMGTDNLIHFHSWDYWDEMAQSVAMAVFIRPGELDTAMAAPAAQHMGKPLTDPAQLPHLKKGEWALLSNPEMDVAATRIRQSIAAGLPPDHIDPDVLNFAMAHHLYDGLS